jgi:hypothetical protein
MWVSPTPRYKKQIKTCKALGYQQKIDLKVFDFDSFFCNELHFSLVNCFVNFCDYFLG